MSSYRRPSRRTFDATPSRAEPIPLALTPSSRYLSDAGAPAHSRGLSRVLTANDPTFEKFERMHDPTELCTLDFALCRTISPCSCDGYPSESIHVRRAMV